MFLRGFSLKNNIVLLTNNEIIIGDIKILRKFQYHNKTISNFVYKIFPIYPRIKKNRLTNYVFRKNRVYKR